MCDRSAFCLFCFTKYFDIYLCIACAYGVSNYMFVLFKFVGTCETVDLRVSVQFSHLLILHRDDGK